MTKLDRELEEIVNELQQITFNETFEFLDEMKKDEKKGWQNNPPMI